MKKCYETNTYIYMALLQIRSILISPWLPSLATSLFNRATKGMLSKLSRPPILFDNDEGNRTALTNRHPHANKDTFTNIPFCP